jgi:hypothetical protein
LKSVFSIQVAPQFLKLQLEIILHDPQFSKFSSDPNQESAARSLDEINYQGYFIKAFNSQLATENKAGRIYNVVDGDLT